MTLQAHTETIVPDLSSFMEDNLEQFTPFAYYDKHLDCIRVQIVDCSVLEVRESRFITFLKDFHGDHDSYIGFTLKGIRHLFVEHELPTSGILKLTEILDQIVRTIPHAAVKKVREEFVGKIEDLEIEFEQAA